MSAIGQIGTLTGPPYGNLSCRLSCCRDKCISSSIWNMPHKGYTQNAPYTEKWPVLGMWMDSWVSNNSMTQSLQNPSSVDLSLPKNQTEKAGPTLAMGENCSPQTCLHWTLAGSLCAEIASLDTFRMTSSISGTNNFLDKMAWNTKWEDIFISCFTANGLLFTKPTWCSSSLRQFSNIMKVSPKGKEYKLKKMVIMVNFMKCTSKVPAFV